MEATKSIVLITGVSREEGIGLGLAKAMAQRGFEVIITARELTKAEELAKKISTAEYAVRAGQLDITNEESVAAMTTFIAASYGRLDVLINNAGGVLDYGVQPLETDFSTTKEAFEINLFGAWRLIRAVHPLLKASSKPRIVNISSGAGSFTHPQFGLAVHPAYYTSYGLSKLALNGLTVQLARQLKADGILINAVNPGFVATSPGMEAWGARSVADSVEGIIWAATLPDDGPSGGFFEDKKRLDW